MPCQALQSTQPEAVPRRSDSGRTGADLVAAMQAMPHKEIDLEPIRTPMPVRSVGF